MIPGLLWAYAVYFGLLFALFGLVLWGIRYVGKP